MENSQAKVAIFISYGCNEGPEVQGLKATQIYCLTILEIRSLQWVLQGLNQRVDRAGSSWGLQGRSCSLPLLTSWDCQHSLACGYIPPIPTLISCFLFMRTFVTTLGPSRSSRISSHLKITSAKPVLPYKGQLYALGVRMWTSLGGPFFGWPQLPLPRTPAWDRNGPGPVSWKAALGSMASVMAGQLLEACGQLCSRKRCSWRSERCHSTHATWSACFSVLVARVQALGSSGQWYQKQCPLLRVLKLWFSLWFWTAFLLLVFWAFFSKLSGVSVSSLVTF